MGFAKSTNKDVACEAGITSGLISYFENKEAFLKAVLEERSPLQMAATITPEILRQPPESFLPLLIKRMLDIIETEQFLSMARVILPENRTQSRGCTAPE